MSPLDGKLCPVPWIILLKKYRIICLIRKMEITKLYFSEYAFSPLIKSQDGSVLIPLPFLNC